MGLEQASIESDTLEQLIQWSVFLPLSLPLSPFVCVHTYAHACVCLCASISLLVYVWGDGGACVCEPKHAPMTPFPFLRQGALDKRGMISAKSFQSLLLSSNADPVQLETYLKDVHRFAAGACFAVPCCAVLRRDCFLLSDRCGRHPGVRRFACPSSALETRDGCLCSHLWCHNKARVPTTPTTHPPTQTRSPLLQPTTSSSWPCWSLLATWSRGRWRACEVGGAGRVVMGWCVGRGGEGRWDEEGPGGRAVRQGGVG